MQTNITFTVPIGANKLYVADIEIVNFIYDITFSVITNSDATSGIG